jgi:hypothetical protein
MKTIRNRCIIVAGTALIGWLALPHGVSAAPPNRVEFSLRGTVRDSGGKAIPGAKIKHLGTIGLGQATPAQWSDVTDANGKYSLSYTRESNHIVIVTGCLVEAPGFVRLHTEPLWEVTMTEGKPGEPREFVHRLPDGEIGLRTLMMPNGDVVSFEGTRAAEVAVLRANIPTELDFVLTRGEILAGSVNVPRSFPYRTPNAKPEDQQFFFSVSGSSFNQTYQTEKGGRFQIWVPKGTYTLEVALLPSAPRLTDVAAGTTNIEWNVVDPAVAEATLARAYDVIWAEMDANYSYFELKKADWNDLRRKYRPLALRATTAGEFADVLLEMFAALRDGHVWIDLNGTHGYPQFTPRKRVENYNALVVQDSLENLRWCGSFAGVGKTKGDGFGVFLMEK